MVSSKRSKTISKKAHNNNNSNKASSTTPCIDKENNKNLSESSTSSSFFDLGFDSCPTSASLASKQQQQPLGVYAIYKEATQAFHNGLAKLLPKGFPLTCIDDYKRGVHAIWQQAGTRRQRWVENPLLDSLNTSIRLRQAQARRYGDNDQGHLYVIRVLEYCREVLRLSNRIMILSQQGGKKEGKTNKKQGRFDALEFPPRAPFRDAWDNWPPQNESEDVTWELPNPPAPPSPVGDESSNADLVQTDDRFQCIAFLETLDQLMGVIREQFDNVKHMCIEQGVESSPGVLHQLMQSSIATNLCIDCVQATWAELTLEHAHIRSFYDLIAIVFVLSNPEAYTKLKAVLSFTNDKFPHLLTHFVGDVVEACFAVDGLDFSKAIKAYGSKLRLEEGGWEKQLGLEDAEQMAWYISEIVMEPGSHKIRQSFLNGYKFIGGRNCILNTLKVIQQVFSFVDNDKDYTALPTAAANTFDFLWDENTNFARQLRGDLDHLLAGQVLPELLAACQHDYALALEENPGVKKIVPVLYSLHIYTSNQCRGPIPIDLTFGMHALLFSIVALQGNDHLKRLGNMARSAFTSYMDALRDSAAAFREEDSELSLLVFDALKQVFEPNEFSISPSSRLIAYWNPFLGGAFGAYSVYMGLASQARYLRVHLRPVLHLYNALRCRKLIDEISILDFLDRVFFNVGAVWMAGRHVRRGEFTKTSMLGTGLGLRDISLILDVKKSDYGIQTNRYRYVNDRSDTFVFNPRMVETVRSSDIVQGHAVLFWKDYSGVAVDAATNDLLCRMNSGDFGDTTDCEGFVVKACQAIRNDIELFGGGFVNLIGVGCLLKFFCNQVYGLIETDEPWHVAVFSELDFASDADLVYAPQIAACMSKHFGKVERGDFVFSSGL